MGYLTKAQRHCDIFPDSITFKRLRQELESYEGPIMLICEENAAKDPIRRRLVSALHTTKRDVVDVRVPDGRFSREDLFRCYSIARETSPGVVLAYDLGVAVQYAHAISTCARSDADPWRMYQSNDAVPSSERIPFVHVFSGLEHYDRWEQVPGVLSGAKGEPDFAIQVTSAIS